MSRQDHGEIATEVLIGVCTVVGLAVLVLNPVFGVLRVSASVTPAGEAREGSSAGDEGRERPSTLVRIAR